MALAADQAISTYKLSVRGRWAGQSKPTRPRRVHLVRPSANTLPSPEEPKDNFDDAAELVLIEGREASRKRQQSEIGEKLQRIKNRIEEIVQDYDEEIDGGVTALDASENPRQLFKSLADPKARSTYYNHLSHCVMTCENKCEELEGILSNLHELLVESQSGGTQQLLEQAEEKDIDLEEATAVLGGALATAKASVNDLVSIKGRMDRLMSNLIAYPDTNKGRKKLEKALLEAQDEVKSCVRNLEELKKKVQDYTDKCGQLQAQLDAKTQECLKLRGSTEEVKQLHLSQAALEKEVKALNDAQKEAKAPPIPLVSTVGINAEKQKKLEEELQFEKSKNQDLEVQMTTLAEQHSRELEAMKAEYEAETKETKGRFEEQLKSLMEDDDIFEEETGGGDDYNLDASLAPASLQLEETEDGSPKEEMPKEEATGVSPEEEQMLHRQTSLDELKQQFARKENQLKLQLEEAKSKYKSKTRILQKQLAEATSSIIAKDEAEKLAKKLKSTLEEVNEELSRATVRIDEFQEKLTSSESENAILSEKLLQKEAEIEKLAEQISMLATKQAAQSHFPSALEISEVPSFQSFPVAPGDSPMMSESIMPLVATEVALDELPDMLPYSLEQSIVSMDPAPLGSPFGSSLLNDRDSVAPSSQHPVPYSLSMLAGSRLSHYSSAAQGAGMSHNHPIIVEWVKAYDLAVKFRDGIVSMLKDHRDAVPQLSALIEELQALDVHEIDKKADAQNQVVEMRFSLTLMLHQMEQTLRESFLQMAEIQCHVTPSAREDQYMHDLQVEELKERVRDLHNDLAVAESHYIAQMDAHKDVIARISTRNESLKIEVSKLKNCVSVQEKIKVAMFNHVDKERNTRILRDAANKKLLSEEEFQSLLEDMESYLTVPASRLVALAHRLLNKEEVKRLVLNLTKTCANTRQAAYMLEGIVFMDQRKEERHRNFMLRYGEKRMDLAQNISDSLSRIEKKLGTTFSKPFYGPPIPKSNGCIVPVNRNMPERCSHLSSDSHRAEVDLGSPVHARSAKTLPSSPLSYRCRDIKESRHTSDSIRQSQYELIQKLQQQNLQQHKEELSVKHRATTADPSYIRQQKPRPAESRRGRHRASTATSNLHSSSPTPGSLHPPMRILPSALYSSGTSFGDNQMWDVKSTQQESYLESKVPGYPFLPKIVELDLPGNGIIGITHDTKSPGTTIKTKQQKSTPSQSSRPSHFTHTSQSAPKTHTIPTIDVPHGPLNTLQEESIQHTQENTTWTRVLPCNDPVSAAH